MYKIGELSKLSRIPAKTLRYYDSEGILRPDFIDPDTGYRYYNAARLSDCYRIAALKELGFRLDEIREIFSRPQHELKEMLDAKLTELCELKKQTENRIHILAGLNSILEEDRAMFNIVIRKSDEIRLAYRREVIAEPSECGRILLELQNELPKELIGSRRVVIDYETEFVSENFDTGFGIEITGKLPEDVPLSEKLLCFPCDTASLVCTENEYADAVRILNKHAIDNHCQIIGPIYKIIYPDNTVEIKLPIARLASFDMNYSEDISVPFINDEDAVGRWEMVDSLPCREMFSPGKPKSALTNVFTKELYFLPGGERYWCFGWTKGLLLADFGYPHRRTRNSYTIEKIGNESYLFVEFKGRYYFEGGRPELWVFRKTDSRQYRRRDIRIVDKIPELPAEDASVLGKWQVCAFVKTEEAFEPDKDCSLLPYEALYWRSAEFKAGGAMANCFLDSKNGGIIEDLPEVWRYVTGYVICTPSQTVSSYRLRRYGDTEYLFVQWKGGDYSFGGAEPSWYVFKRQS